MNDAKIDNIVSVNDLCYGANKKDNTLNLHYPKDANGKLPTIIIVHGGGYVSGDKKNSEGYAKLLASKGFCVINIEYSKCDNEDGKYFIDQLADVYDMFEYIKKEHIVSDHIDFDNIFLAGDSAGAHISSMVANIQTNKALKGEFNLLSGPNIKGLIFVSPVFGPYGFGGLPLGIAFKKVVYGKDYKKMPITKKLHAFDVLSKDFPPTIMFSMANDFVAGPHKIMFCDRAKKLNIPLEHYSIRKGFKLFHDSVIDYPFAYPNCIDKIVNFVNKVANNDKVEGFSDENLFEDVKQYNKFAKAKISNSKLMALKAVKHEDTL